jgi:hypothetical protein
MGGFAEDALLHGGYSRDHNDVDLLVERSELDGLLAELRPLGYDAWETWGENAAGEPFYLAKEADGVLIELGVVDRNAAGDLYLEIARVPFQIDGRDPPVGYRVHFSADTFEHPPATFEGLSVRCGSPLFLYQMRAGIGSRGTFGALRPSDRAATDQLRAAFFPDSDEQALLPRIDELE